MKKKNINNRKKALTAVGAVVAAGLTPGFITASAAGSSIQSPNSGTTAAEVVAIDGQAYSFNELYAKQHPDSVEMDTIVLNIVLEPSNTTLYGSPVPVIKPYKKKDNKKKDNNVIYWSVEQMPRFPGGEAALEKYIDSHLKYPQAQESVEGQVIVQFVVKQNGGIGEVKVVRSMGKIYDLEAIRLVKSLPKFTPGRQNGKAVRVWYTLPVTFKQRDNTY